MNKISKREIILITVVAISFILMPFVFSPSINEQQNYFSSKHFFRILSENVMLTIFFILNYFFFTTKFYFKKKYIIYGIALIVSFILIYKIPEFIFPFEKIEGRGPKGLGKFGTRRPPLFIFWSPKVLMFSCVTLITVTLKQNKRYQEIKEEKQLSEIAYLQAQINPHFLFNTLNNIYALTLQKSEFASDAVMKLSKMMRFVVSESSKEVVLLAQDLDYIKNYIQLQQLRLLDKKSIDYIVEGNPKNLKISPLLLINFIENAFKYGVMDEVDNPIKIYITIEENNLELYVENKIESEKLIQTDKSEVGLKNSKKRLEYLYTNKYDLDINQDSENFYVNLKLTLDD